MSEKVKTKKEKIYNYIKIGAVIVFGLWLVFSINGVQNTAKENKNIVMRPEYNITYVPGGPERFVGGYRDVVNIDTENNVEEKNYLWSTVLITNKGNEDASEIEIKLNTAYPMNQILVSPSGYNNKTEVEMNDDKLTADINIEELEINNTAYLFIGFNPDSIEKPYNQKDKKLWANSYEEYLQNVNVETTQSNNTFYAVGYRKLFTSE